VHFKASELYCSHWLRHRKRDDLACPERFRPIQKITEPIFRINAKCKGTKQTLLEEYWRDLKHIIDKAGLKATIKQTRHGRTIDIYHPQPTFELKVKELKRASSTKWEELLDLKYEKTALKVSKKTLL
jgi:hypothetical protein